MEPLVWDNYGVHVLLTLVGSAGTNKFRRSVLFLCRKVEVQLCRLEKIINLWSKVHHRLNLYHCVIPVSKLTNQLFRSSNLFI